jgi:hypothetical protein
MGLTNFILGRKKHDYDYSDIKGHVLGKPFSPEPQTIGEKFGLDKMQEFPAAPYEPNKQIRGPAPVVSRENYSFDEPSRIESGHDFDRQPAQRRDMDIIDRMSIIESQLQAIRSQTETINERLKNIDAKLGARRY